MTGLNYLEEDAALIVENLPEGFEATAETASLFLIYAVLMRAKGIYTTLEDVHDGVIASRIAAHAADIVKGVPGAAAWDKKMAEARKKLDWEAQLALAIDPARARSRREARNDAGEGACSMCGDYCAVEIIQKYFDKPSAGRCD